MYQPQTPAEYLDLVNQVIFEIDDLIMCAEDEGEGDLEFTSQLPLFQQLARDVRQLQADLQAGRHTFVDGSDLPFMAAVRRARARIPFMALLDALNVSHRKGF
jgi:hypothetical protein